MPPLTLESGLAWPLSGVALAREVHCGSIRGSLPKAPSPAPQGQRFGLKELCEFLWDDTALRHFEGV